MQCGGEHQPGRDCGEEHPGAEGPPPDPWGSGADCRSSCRRRRQPKGAQRSQQHEHDIAAAPHKPLGRDGQQGLHDQRVSEQTAEAAEVRGGIERIRIAPAGEREPALHQRRLRREDEEQRADRDRQKPRHPQEIVRMGRWHGAAETDRKHGRGNCEGRDVNRGLKTRPQACQPVAVGIAREQQRLVHEHRRVPHCRSAAEPRERHSRDQRLDEEQQEGTGENRRDETQARGNPPAIHDQSRACHSISPPRVLHDRERLIGWRLE